MRAQRSVVVASFLVVFVLGFWVAGLVRATSASTYDDWNTLAAVFTQVRDHYVEPVNEEKLLQSAIRGMLRSLDPHSQYLDKSDYTDLRTSTTGAFGGIGIQIGVRGNYPTVISPIEGTPAFNLGIQTGDRIVQIEGKPTEGFTIDQVIARLRGAVGTKVNITIAREGEDKLLSYAITRAKIEVKSVPYHYVMANGIGYMRVTVFSETTGEEVHAALEDFARAKAKGVVFDLRYNPGGLLSQAVEVGQQFVTKGEEIVQQRPRSPQQIQTYYSQNPHPYNFPMVVLVNGGSASASEIVAGAWQDHDLALVVGTTSYGKGSVQSIFPLSGSTALKLTTAKWYTPAGRSIHKDEGERDLLASDEVDKVGDSSASEDGADPQDVAAADAAARNANKPKFRTLDRKRIVYGGGGITPDVEIKPEKLTSLESKVEGRGIAFNFIVKYAGQHKDLTLTAPVTDPMFTQFVAAVKKENIDFTQEEMSRDRSYFERALRREIARRVSGDAAAFRVVAEGDNQLQAAVDLITKYKTTPKLLDYAASAHASVSTDTHKE